MTTSLPTDAIRRAIRSPKQTFREDLLLEVLANEQLQDLVDALAEQDARITELRQHLAEAVTAVTCLQNDGPVHEAYLDNLVETLAVWGKALEEKQHDHCKNL